MGTPAFPPDRPAPSPARFHRAGEPWPLYASLEPATAWAEWSAATRGGVDPAAERRRLWELDIRDLAVLDLRRPSAVEAIDIDPGEIVRSRGTARRAAVRARSLGAEGMVVPSAAHPGHWNLVVFPSGFGRVRPGRARTVRPRPPG